MRLCKRGVNFVQIIDNQGSVRLCSWKRDGGIVGKLSDNTLYEILHNDKANEMVRQLAEGDYSSCRIDGCPWLSNGTVNKHLVEIDGMPEYPEELYLAFEQACNYRCIGCTVHNTLKRQVQETTDLDKDYECIEEKIEDVLPHLKLISANGMGELFCSPHIMKILANWKPIAPKEEIRVELETNGSLFNEKNWKKIENLGQYHLTVMVTVMSFNEKTYQYLSGTKLPIENIRNNLRFISELRQAGIVNDFQIATVYQESNFRELPDYCREALSYKPDYIRLRPFEPWGIGNRAAEWYADVRGKYHPSHQEFLEVMKDSVFANPIIHDWGGGLESELNDFPLMAINEKTQTKSDILTWLLVDDDFADRLYQRVGNKTFSIYGCGNIGRALAHTLTKKIKVSNMLDQTANGQCEGIDIVKPFRASEDVKSGTVLLTVMYDKDELTDNLRKQGYTGEILDVRDLVCC